MPTETTEQDLWSIVVVDLNELDHRKSPEIGMTLSKEGHSKNEDLFLFGEKLFFSFSQMLDILA